MQYAVIGKNINYSRSPDIFKNLFQLHQIDGNYKIINIQDITEEMPNLRHLSGFNVTIPYKETIFSYCNVCDESAKSIGSVNCVAVKNGEFFGYNTDVYGFYMLLKFNGELDKKRRKVLVIGGGGAAKAVYYTLNKYTEWNITVATRNVSKAEILTEKALSLNQVNATDYDLLINCTSSNDPLPFAKIKPKAAFIDINYQWESLFLAKAKALGGKTVDGHDMLLFQAKKSYEIWFNTEISADELYQAWERK